jgi:two-component system sensor histidine kinase YesM
MTGMRARWTKIHFFKRIFKADTLLKRLLIPYLLTSIFIVGSTIYNIYTISIIGDRLNSTYSSNANVFDLTQSLKAALTDTNNYLSTRSSDALEDYYRDSGILLQKSKFLNVQILDSKTLLLQRTISRLISAFTEEMDQAITAKRGRDVEAYTLHYEASQRIFLYIMDYSDQLNSDLFQINYTEYIRLEKLLNDIQMIDLVVLSLIIGINFIIVLMTAVRISSPIKTLAQRADQVAGGNLDALPIIVNSHDEISILASAFNSMILSLRAYVEKIRENLIRERQQKEQEMLMENLLQTALLKNLQAQINPHFLFNALNTGAQMAMLEDAEETSEFLEHVAAFYRYNTIVFDRDVTLAEEVRMIKDYIYIQKIRFTDRIDYYTHIDPVCLDLQMPGLILQPLVENALAHGLKDVEKDGRIEIIITALGSTVEILICDNGRGMDPAKVQQILDCSAPEYEPLLSTENVANRISETGIGLKNVIKRLRLFYNQKNIVEIVPNEGNIGTIVRLIIPRIGKEPEKEC